MKRLEVFVMVAATTCLGASSYSQYDGGARDRVESLIKSRAGGSDAVSTFRERVKEYADKFVKNEEIKKLTGKVIDQQEENEKLGTIPPIIAAADKKKLDEAIKKNDAVKKTANNLSRQSAVSTNLSSGDLEEACRAGVDFGGLKVSADDVSKNTYTSTEMKKIARDEADKLEKAEDEAAIKAAQALKGLTKSSDRYDDKGPQQKYLDDNARIEGLKKTLSKEEKERDWRWEKVFDAISQSTQKNRKANRDRADASELAGFAADDVLSRVNRARQLGADAARALRNNCVKEANILGRDNPFAQNTLLNSAYETMKQWNASYANGGFLSMIQSVSAGLTCPDVSGDLDALWSPVMAAAETLRGATDPLVLGQSFVALNDAVTFAQSQVETKIVPLKDSCNFAARNRKKVEQFVSSISSQIQNAAGQNGSTGAARSSSTGSSTNARPAPNAFAHTLRR